MYNNWEDLEESIRNCNKCKLCRTRKNIVFGCGNKTADIMMIGEGPGADEDTQGIPFVGKACESAGHIFVDRSGPKKVLETIRQAKDSLKDGVSLVVFPEGARSFTGHMGYFKKGAFQLADDLQLAVVPVTIDGSFEILPRTGKWIHRHRMILTIHDPIPPKGQGADNIKATMAEAYTAVESALPDKFKGMVKNEDQDL